VEQLNRWQEQFGDQISFVVVYIAEAHAMDTWPLGKHVELNSHKTFAERVQASELLINKYGCKIPVMYDGMDNQFDKVFAVWPERYYLLSHEKVKYIWYPTTEFGYNRASMKSILQQLHTFPQEEQSWGVCRDYDFSYLCP